MTEPADRPVAIVTGGASGIGAASARALADRGYALLINYSRSAEQASALVEEIVSGGGDAIAVQGSVAEDPDCRRIADAALERWDRIDALVQSAGTTQFISMSDLEAQGAADFHHIYAVNVIGAYQMARAAQSGLSSSSNGAIVTISSIASLNGTGSSYAYAASKGALNTLTLALARNLAPIRVNAVLPGVVDGEWLRKGLGEDGFQRARSSFAEGAALGRICTPEDIATTVEWLICDAKAVTGQLITTDAGTMIGAPPQVVPR